MPINSKIPAVAIILLAGALQLQGERHPKEEFGRAIFNAYRTNDLDAFFANSIFSLNETTFRAFLKDVRNRELRENLISLHKLSFPKDATNEQKWEEAFKHNWREQWRHLVRNSRKEIHEQAFSPVLEGAARYDIQWKTTKLVAIEAFLPVTWTNVGFKIKGDTDLDLGASNPRTFFVDRDLTYRLRLDNLTYAKAFMVGLDEQDSEKAYGHGILGNGAGEGDVLIRFGEKTPNQLYYFCPDQKGAGGNILVKDATDANKPNQRTDILLTFTYGQPTRFYQILVRDVIQTRSGPLFCERPEWIGVVERPLGIPEAP